MHTGIQRASRCAHLRRYRLSLSRERDRDGLLRRAASRPVPPRAWETHGEPCGREEGKQAEDARFAAVPLQGLVTRGSGDGERLPSDRAI